MSSTETDLKAIFCEALEHAGGAERSAYLDGACRGDATLRLHVESLLKAHDDAGGFMKTPPPGANAILDHTPEPDDDDTSAYRATVSEGSGMAIGPYKLLQKIGEGGMGAVFMAEQEKPVRRKVALKARSCAKQLTARFSAESAKKSRPNLRRVSRRPKNCRRSRRIARPSLAGCRGSCAASSTGS
jgi:hypothetical protein